MKAILIEKDDAGYRSTLKEIADSDLPEGDVLVAVEYTGLNYKDSLAITGKSPIVRSFPMIPGVDFAGTVIESTHASYRAGDKVIMGGWGVGELHWGGLAQKARVKGDWLTPLPKNLTTRQAMTIGTAGLTAALCVDVLEQRGVTPDKGEVVVSGASGGVGSVAVALLAKRGFNVVALSGKLEEAEYLKAQGATSVLDRHTLPLTPRPLEKERWAGVVDTLGSHTLATLCAQTKYYGVVAACGLAQGADFPASVMPFILRGITLQGVESVYAPLAARVAAWNRLAGDLSPEFFARMERVVSLEEALAAAELQVNSRTRGRVVVDVNR